MQRATVALTSCSMLWWLSHALVCLPAVQVLQDAYGGFISDSIITDYEYYASTVFQLFGDRV